MVNWNFLLSYSTSKVVIVRDWRVGILYYTCLTGILLYIVGYQIVYQKRYLTREAPVGTVRISLLEPEGRSPPGVRTRAENLTYCLQHSNSSHGGFQNFVCKYWPASLVVYPVLEDHGMLAATRVTKETYNLPPNCSMTEYGCNYGNVSKSKFYIAGVEEFTLLIDHSVTCSRLDIQYNANDLPGRLRNHEGKYITYLPPPSILGTVGKYDIIELGYLLKSAGLDSLEEPSTERSDRTMRDNGLVLVIFIEYKNTFSFNLNRFQYTYKAFLVPDTKFKTEQPLYSSDMRSMEVLNRHGIRIHVIQIGECAAFSLMVLSKTNHLINPNSYLSGTAVDNCFSICFACFCFIDCRFHNSENALWPSKKYI